MCNVDAKSLCPRPTDVAFPGSVRGCGKKLNSFFFTNACQNIYAELSCSLRRTLIRVTNNNNNNTHYTFIEHLRYFIIYYYFFVFSIFFLPLERYYLLCNDTPASDDCCYPNNTRRFLFIYLFICNVSRR